MVGCRLRLSGPLQGSWYWKDVIRDSNTQLTIVPTNNIADSEIMIPIYIIAYKTR